MDAILGIEHQNSPLTHHLEQMKIYMPKSHRAFLQQLLQGPSVKFSIDNQSITDTQIINLYNDWVKQIDAFRQMHLQFAKSYIQKQAQKDHANPTETGTGGTPFIRYLSEHKKKPHQHYQHLQQIHSFLVNLSLYHRLSIIIDVGRQYCSGFNAYKLSLFL